MAKKSTPEVTATVVRVKPTRNSSVPFVVVLTVLVGVGALILLGLLGSRRGTEPSTPPVSEVPEQQIFNDVVLVSASATELTFSDSENTTKTFMLDASVVVTKGSYPPQDAAVSELAGGKVVNLVVAANRVVQVHIVS